MCVRHRMSSFFPIFFVLLCFLGCGAPPAPIIPTPQHIHWGKGDFVCADSLTIYFHPDFFKEAHQLQQLFQSMGGQGHSPSHMTLPQPMLVVTHQRPTRQKISHWPAEADFRPEMEREGYFLDINPRRILLCAKTAAGLFYALSSLGALVDHQSESGRLRAVRIRDWPDFSLRGISDDMSRGQVSTLDYLQSVIRFLAAHKMNTYMPYIEDIFPFRAFPTIGENRGVIRPEEWRELQDLAENLHVQIVPIFQTLGHYENILLQPEFRHLADYPGAASLNITLEETYDFLQAALDEIVPVFRAPYFHIGGDESFDVGRGASRERVRQIGLARAHAEHYQRVIQMLRPYHKTVMMYGDMILHHPEMLPLLPQDVLIMDWDYDVRRRYKTPEIFARARRPFLVSPGINNWRKIFPDWKDGMRNIERFTRTGLENGAQGMIASAWNDYGAASLRELNYLGYAFAAECAWNGGEKHPKRFVASFLKDFYGVDHPGMLKSYQLLNEMTRDVSYLHFFSHPFYQPDRTMRRQMRRNHALIPKSRQVSEHLSAMRSRGVTQVEKLDLLQLCADFFNWYGRLSLAQEKMLRLAKKLPQDITPNERSVNSNALLQLSVDLESLSERYAAMWLRANRPENLQLVQEMLQRVVRYLQIKAEEAQKGDFAFNGRNPASFVSFSTKNYTGNDTENLYLRRTLFCDTLIQRARMQLIADSHARVWINGRLVGETLARRSLSALVQKERVKVWDIREYLRPGHNVIAVHIINYVPNGVAAANVWLEIDDQIDYTGKDGWTASPIAAEGWKEPVDQELDWPSAVPVANSWTISRPYFEQDLPSRIEFFK